MVAITVPQSLAGYDLSTFETETEGGANIRGLSRGIFREEGSGTDYGDGPILVLIHGYPQT